MTLVLLCSGQGGQHAGMFALTGDAPEAASLFAHATSLLGGKDPRELVRTETEEFLHRDRVGQILCALQALAASAAISRALPDQRIIAGYSVGEVAAWGVAGFVDRITALDLVARRAEVMDDASPRGDGLLFVRGLSRRTIDGLCEQHDVAVAIVNPGEAFVVGGNRTALKVFAEAARAMDAVRVVGIEVEVASHTRRLAPASDAFCGILCQLRANFELKPRIRLLSGIDGAPVLTLDAGLNKLAAQISQTVQWASCLENCIEAGATVLLELGPGSALSRMVADSYSDVTTRSLDDFRKLDGVCSWLAAHDSERP